MLPNPQIFTPKPNDDVPMQFLALGMFVKCSKSPETK